MVTEQILKAIVATSISVILFLAVGMIHVVWASSLAQFYRHAYKSNRIFRVVSPFGGWIRSPNYETAIRTIGALMVGVALLLLWVMIRGLLGTH